MNESRIKTDYKLFTAEVTSMYFYSNDGSQIINILARSIEEAVAVAKEYVKENHVILKVINNDEKNVYMFKEK